MAHIRLVQDFFKAIFMNERFCGTLSFTQANFCPTTRNNQTVLTNPSTVAKINTGTISALYWKSPLYICGSELRRFIANEGNADRKSTRLNSSHRCISYAVFCLKKK